MILVLIAVSWAVAFAATPVVARLAARWGFVDRPATHKFHDRPTPLLGGLALYLGALAPLVLLRSDLGGARFWSFAAVASLLFAVGILDDRRHISAYTKLLIQVVAALGLVAVGFRAELPLPDWATAAISCVWIVGITNAFNLLDNMDGATAGVAAIASAACLVLASPSPFVTGLSAALLGSTLGFLPYNFHPARLFMGDGGSLFLGLSLATLGLEARFEGVSSSVAWMLPVLILVVPIFDTTLVSWSRLRRGKNPLVHPGKDHFGHRLSRQGWGVRGAVLGLYLLGAAGGLLALAVQRGGFESAWPISAAAALVAGMGLVWLDRPGLIGERSGNSAD